MLDTVGIKQIIDLAGVGENVQGQYVPVVIAHVKGHPPRDCPTGGLLSCVPPSCCPVSAVSEPANEVCGSY